MNESGPTIIPSEGGIRRQKVLTTIGYGLILFVVFTFGTLFELMVTKGVCFVYVIGYFMSLVTVHAILKVKQFGTGMAVFLPYAILGFFVEYMVEVVITPALIAPWAALVWSLNGPLAGISADLTHRLLPTTLRWQFRSAFTGLITVLTYFLLILITLAILYNEPAPGLAHYLNGIFLTFPWLLIMGLFGGYTAGALSSRSFDKC